MFDLNNSAMSNIDAVLVVNKEYEIVYNSRFDEQLSNSAGYDPLHTRYRNLFEMYPSISRRDSSIVKCIQTGEVFYNERQTFTDINGKKFVTWNVTFPIFQNGKILGAVELTKDLTTMKDLGKREKIAHDALTDDGWHDNRHQQRITFEDILTVAPKMISVIEHAKVSAGYDNPTLIYGETGTGKEMFAQAIMNYGGNSMKRAVIQNCAAVPENLMESILFGTTKGSYTGAENKKGLFEEADRGILFLDELNAMPYALQGKLLRVVQDGTFRPIGANREKEVKAKIIAAMNIEPMRAIEDKTLRKDLFYRFSSNMIYLPPLRERKEDITYLTEYFIEVFNKKYHKNVKGLTEELGDMFLTYEWEGNVRELKHVIEPMVSMAKGDKLFVDDVPLYLYHKLCEQPIKEKVLIPTETESEATVAAVEEVTDLNVALEKVEKQLIIEILKKTGGNKTKAGELLNIPRQTLKYKMDKLGIRTK